MIAEKIKIIIVEDDPISSIFIESVFEHENYEIIGIATTLNDAKILLDSLKPDALICDVNLDGQVIFSLFSDDKYSDIPKLFITNHVDYNTYNSTQLVKKSAFLAKPTHTLTLLSSFELLLKQYPLVENKHDYITVRDKHSQIIKLLYRDIAWIQAEGNYSIINTIDNKKFVRRKSMKQIMRDLDNRFVQIQKAYVINKDYIKKIDPYKKMVFMDETPIPIGRVYHTIIAEYFDKIE